MSTNNWQPIETAPKDFTPCLLYAIGADKRPMIIIGRWACAAHFMYSMRVCGTGKKGPCEFRWLGEMGSKYGVEFTHWQPVPAPPTL